MATPTLRQLGYVLANKRDLLDDEQYKILQDCYNKWMEFGVEPRHLEQQAWESYLAREKVEKEELPKLILNILGKRRIMPRNAELEERVEEVEKTLDRLCTVLEKWYS